ncbi:MAG: right-handed parallel beta-helix repeat-containing protein, partial [Candidatus Thermoplasmatota archaeon]|nr:right-handed parallel beta-helix repeat-containing protein [Candidatus Thermoplasmatota archaeon]
HSYDIYLSNVEHSMIISNSITKSTQSGLYLRAGCYKNNITSNIFTENEKGTHVQGSTENIFVNNLYMNNGRGIYFCCQGEDNLVYSNFFIENNEHVYGYLINKFDNGTLGNFWDDYSGFDNDGDGIGDIAYIVTDEYGIENIDRYPIFNENIDSDIDDDGLNNYIENKIGSDPFIKNNYTTFLINNSEYYLVDTDNDTIYDVLYNSISENIGITEKQNMDYLIDYNSDGRWDYIWSNDGKLNPYEEKKDVDTPGFEFIMVFLVFIILIITFRIKKRGI